MVAIREKRKSSSWRTGAAALTISMVSSYFSYAPFTPAIVLVLLTVPLAMVATIGGSWRLGLSALYWSGVSILLFPTVIPNSHNFLIDIIVGVGMALLVLFGASYAFSVTRP